MPIPVPIPSGALAVSDADTARAEALVEAVVQVIQYGTSGSLVTPSTTVPTGPGNVLQPVVLSTPAQQLFLRQLAVGIATALVNFQVSTVPGPYLVPQARGDGTLDPAWVTGGGGGGGGGSGALTTFAGICLSSAAVGDLVYVSGAGKTTQLCDITDLTKLPAVGCITSKPTSTTCVVQCQGIVASIYSGLTPGAIYMVGTDGRPTATVPSPSTGTSLFLQAIGVALDVDSLLLSPSMNLSEVRD